MKSIVSCLMRWALDAVKAARSRAVENPGIHAGFVCHKNKTAPFFHRRPRIGGAPQAGTSTILLRKMKWRSTDATLPGASRPARKVNTFLGIAGGQTQSQTSSSQLGMRAAINVLLAKIAGALLAACAFLDGFSAQTNNE
ncbi:hypothetical protein [Polaromonas naphthalenivorans]|nr:hypothetical protein [Polaromonas naphthalenivorans]